MELSVLDRLLILNILPEEGNVITLKMIRDIKELVGFNAEEVGFLKFEYPGGGVRWDPEYKDYTVEVDLPGAFREYIKERLMDLNKKEKLHEEHISIYDKFVV